jgi:hypothetical protein
MNVHIVARKFELKLAQSMPSGIDLAAIKDKALANLRKHIAEMSEIIKKSKELREIAFTLPADPLAKFGENATKGIKNCEKIISGAFYLDNKMNALSLEDLVKPLLSIAVAISSLSLSKGSDKWGLMRDRYLDILEVYGDYYTSQGGYGELARLNPMAKRDMEVKFSSVTNVLDFLANHLRNTDETGALDILKKISLLGIIKDDSLLKAIDDISLVGRTDRVARRLENHEKEQILILFDKFLGISKLGLMPDIHTWNKYVGTSPVTEKYLSDVFRAFLRAPVSIKQDLKPGEKIGPKNKILSKTTVYKLEEAAKIIVENKRIKDKQEQDISEKMFGSPELPSKIKPLKNVRELIDRLSGVERGLWNKIPTQVQIKVLNNKIDLDSALAVAQEFSEHATMVGNKLDVSLFDNLD